MLSDYVLANTPMGVSSASGDIYRAQRSVDELNVAVKFNRDSTSTSLARFERENDILHNLHPHKGIIEPLTRIQRDIHDGIEKDYYVMELCDATLEEWLHLPDSNKIENKIAVFKQICNALKYAHDHGYIHRDLHIENVLMNLDPNVIKIIDFGRAYDFNSQLKLSREDPAWGHLVMPPEVRFGAVENVNNTSYKRGDVYSLGLLWLYLFQEGMAPIYKVMQAISDIKIHILTNIPDNISTERFYVDTELALKQELYQSSMSRWEPIFQDISTTELADVELGIKITNLANKLLAYDYNKRFEDIDSVLIALEDI